MFLFCICYKPPLSRKILTKCSRQISYKMTCGLCAKQTWLYIIALVVIATFVSGKSLHGLKDNLVDDFLRVSLNYNRDKVFEVAFNSNVQLVCRNETVLLSKWYRNDKFLGEMVALTLQSIKPSNTGLFSCFHSGHWSYLTLVVRIENDITALGKIENANSRILYTDKADDTEDYSDYSINDNAKSLVVSLSDNPGKPKFKQPSKLNRIVSRLMGSTLVLSCAGEGYPPPNITWHFNGNPLPFTGRYGFKKWSLVLINITESDSGRYTCALCNSFGCVDHSTKVIVTADRLIPVISPAMVNQTVLIDENVIFECHVISGLEPHIVWVKHEKHTLPIEQLEHNLYIQNNYLNVSVMATPLDEPHFLKLGHVQHVDEGWYSCIAANSVGKTIASAYLKVLSEKDRLLPIISPSLVNQTVVVDDNVSFECAIGHSTSTHIVWVKHEHSTLPIEQLEHNLKQLKEYLPSTNMSIMITVQNEPHLLKLGHVQDIDEGWYTCVAENDVGKTMSSAYLRVLTNKMTTRVTNVEFPNNESETFVLDGDYDDDDEGTELDPRILSSPNGTSYVDYSGVNNTKSMSSLNTASTQSTADIMEGPPSFRNGERLVSHVHKPAGSSLQLRCPAVGKPTPNITWTLNNTDINRSIGMASFKKWTLLMEDAITDDSGKYTCRVCNEHGCIEHSTQVIIFDRLRSKPIISDKFPSNQTVLVNQTAIFECRVVTDLEPYIWWIKYTNQNDSITNLEEKVPSLGRLTPQNMQLGIVPLPHTVENPHVLKLKHVTHADEGWYTCVASTSLGNSMASAYLKVIDVLPKAEVAYTLWRTHPIWVTVVAVVIVAVFLFGSIFIIYVMRKLKHEKLLKHRIETVHQWTKKVIIYKPQSESSSCDLQMPVIKIEKQRTTFQTSSSNGDPAQAFNEYEFPLDSNWEFPRSQLTLGTTLGEGAFGRVVMAEATDLSRLTASNNGGSSIVAVKMVKEEHTDADMASLVREMEVMKMIGKHINIINLLGCCSQSGPLWVIVEYAPHGNLKDFLKKNRPTTMGSPFQERNDGNVHDKPPIPLSEKNLTSFAYQIARGMEYLASRRCIHRDLAARNVLVTDNYVMKIADFGLARDIQDTDYYRKNTNGRLPIKWMAPESLQEKFYDSQSDVWSYGVLLWEIMTYGEQPYPNIMSAEELYSYLITGQRMEKPPRCSLNIYMLMRQCWHFNSCTRPTFSELVENLDKLTTNSCGSNEEYLDLSIAILETPPSSSDEEFESEPETFEESSPLHYQYTYKFK